MSAPSFNLANLFCDFLESVITCNVPKQDLPFLKGNFAPVQESGPHHNLPVAGKLPTCLNGELICVGPNPKFKPVAGYQWVDGDGMLHGVRIKNGKVTYISRYVKTAKLLQEESYGAAKFCKVGDLVGDWYSVPLQMVYFMRFGLGLLDASNGVGTGNTALVYHNRRLMALHEIDKPYVIQMFEDGYLRTMGRLDYDKNLSHSFSAHPKVDPVTGEMFFFGYEIYAPQATYRVVSKHGVIGNPVPITLSEAVVMHDFAITENYAIFMDLPMIINKMSMILGKHLFTFDSTRKACFGILPRYSTDEQAIRWFELPSCYILHTANAWEEGDEIILYACRMLQASLDLNKAMESNKGAAGELYEFRFSLRNGRASQKRLSQRIVEFPSINKKFLGRKQRYIYTALFDEPLKSTGIVKFDLEKKHDGIVPNVFLYGPNRFGSEPIFVARSQSNDLDEDDGYLMSFVHDEELCKSEVVVVDAKTMHAVPVGMISLPVRVPYVCHSIFVSEEQLLESMPR